MNYAAYGLSQGMSGQNQGNQLINAMNTASLIQYRRDQQRLQNRYADIAQQNADLEAEKWGMNSKLKQQELEQKIFELEQKQLKVSGDNFVNVSMGAIGSQDPTAMNNLIQQDSNLKKIADTAGIVGFSFFNQYSDEELRKLGVAEGMNPREYMITLNSDGTKSLINARNLMATMGVGRQFSQAQINDVFDQHQLSSLNQFYKIPFTAEGVQQAKSVADRQTQIEKVYNTAVESEGKGVQDTRTAAMKNQAQQTSLYGTATDLNVPMNERFYALRQIQDPYQLSSAAATNYRAFSNTFDSTTPEILRERIKSSNLTDKEKQEYLTNLDYITRIIKDKISQSTLPAVKKAVEETTKFVSPIFDATKRLANSLQAASSGDKSAIQKVNSSIAKLFSYLPDKAMSKAAITEIENSSDFTMITAKMLQYVSGLTTNMQDTKNNLNRFGNYSSQNSLPVMIGLRSLLSEFIAKYDSFQQVLNPEEFQILFGGATLDGMKELRDSLDDQISIAGGTRAVPKQKDTPPTTPSQQTSKLDPETSLLLDNLLKGAK